MHEDQKTLIVQTQVCEISRTGHLPRGRSSLWEHTWGMWFGNDRMDSRLGFLLKNPRSTKYYLVTWVKLPDSLPQFPLL